MAGRNLVPWIRPPQLERLGQWRHPVVQPDKGASLTIQTIGLLPPRRGTALANQRSSHPNRSVRLKERSSVGASASIHGLADRDIESPRAQRSHGSSVQRVARRVPPTMSLTNSRASSHLISERRATGARYRATGARL